MILRFAQLLLLTFICSNLFSQIPLHGWRDHYSFRKGNAICYGSDKIFCATNIGICTYRPSTGEVSKMTKTNGLSDVDVNALNYIEEEDLLVVGYSNGNIDLIYNDQIVNIADILNKSFTGSKSINNILKHNSFYYLSTGFGIVVLNAEKKEIKDTYYIGTLGSKINVNSLQIFNGRFYAATDEGLLSADITNQFLYNYQNWTKENYSTSLSTNKIIDAEVTANSLYFIEQKGIGDQCSLWMYQGNSFSEISTINSSATDISIKDGKILVSTYDKILIYNLQGLLTDEISQYIYQQSIRPHAAIVFDSENIAIADKSTGLVFGTPQSLYSRLPNGTMNNTSFALGVSSKHVVSVAGAYNSMFVNSWTSFSTSLLANNSWSNYVQYGIHDAVAVEFSPSNESEYYVGSWGYGIMQFNGTTLENHYTPDNSSLQANEFQQCRISGMCFDSKRNLWVSNPLTTKPISVRKTDGTWASFNYSTLINTDKVSTIHCSSNNTLWLLMPREAIFALNPGNNIDSQDDDKFKRFKPIDSNGATYSLEYNSMAFDQNGYLWLGTSQGILLCYNPNSVFDKSIVFQRIKLPDVVEGFAVYMLENENITAITIDGGNRKWIGTSKSGVFLYSEDGTEELLHFDMENSPLPSNNILDIKIHPTTGEVFMGTEKGLVSYRGESTASANTFDNVFAYPNPVHPNFTGDIAIVGLINNTIVKITDVSGNLVYETKSIGGSAIWNGKNLNGHRVATGVYLVFLANSDGSQKAVTKILFIN